MLVNYLPAKVLKPLVNAANEEILEALIEDARAEQECGRGDNALGLRGRADVLAAENIAVPEHLQRLERNFNLALQGF